jgi:carbon storage regulator
MLVLSRKVGERVVLEDGIIVEVLDVKGRQIRLGIAAPADVTIWREELCTAPELVSASPGRVRKPR